MRRLPSPTFVAIHRISQSFFDANDNTCISRPREKEIKEGKGKIIRRAKNRLARGSLFLLFSFYFFSALRSKFDQLFPSVREFMSGATRA